MSSNYELKNNIKKEINECKMIIAAINRNLYPADRKIYTVNTIKKYQETQMRFHQITLMIIIAAEENKPKSIIEDLHKKRKEYMLVTMELLPELVEEGVVSEKSYIDTCNQYKEDIEVMEMSLSTYE